MASELKPRRAIRGIDFINNIKSCIYGWKRDDEYLYIGQSVRGHRRLYNHDIINKIERVESNDWIVIWECPESELMDMEIYLIIKYKPRLNRNFMKDFDEHIDGLSIGYEEWRARRNPEPKEKKLIVTDLPIFICLYCKQEKFQTRKGQKYCNDNCRNAHWIQLHPRG